MTVRGTICLVLDGAVLILALGSGIRELLVAALCVAAFWLYSLLSLLLAAATLHTEGAVEPAEVVREQAARYRFTLEGWVLLPVSGHVVVRSPGAAGTDGPDCRRHAFFLHPSFRRWHRTFEVELPCAHRGYWPMRPDSLRLQDVFGLFSLPIVRRGQVQPLPVTLCVLPQVPPLAAEQPPSAATNGFAVSLIRHAESGELFGDTRQYQEGDPIKRVHWKQTARTGQVYIRQFEAQENPQVLVLLDLGCGSRDTVRLADIATEVTTALAQYTVRQGKSLQVLPVRPAEEHPADGDSCWVHSERDMSALRRRLAEVAFHPGAEPLNPWQLQDARTSGVGVIRVVTDNPSAALLDTLKTLKDHGRQVSCIVPSAGEPDPAVRAVLHDASCRAVVITDPGQISEKVGMCL